MRLIPFIVLPLSLVAPASAQTLLPGGSEPVEQSIGDVSPLAVSMRRIEPGLSTGANFDQVFRYGDGFLRVQGGLYAVFDNSIYLRDQKRKGGMNAVVPPGTMYYIGAPPDPGPRQPPPHPDRVEGRLDLKVSTRYTTAVAVPPLDARAPQRDAPEPAPGALAPPAGPPPVPGAIIGDPEYRALRIRMMMRRAAQQHRAADTAPVEGQAAVGRSSFSSSK
jgi:hypothetical protein